MLARYSKQSTETHDYEFDWNDYFAERSDSYLTHSVSVPAGLTLVGSSYVDNVLRVLLSGGAPGQQYKVTFQVITTSGVIEEEEFLVRIRDV